MDIDSLSRKVVELLPNSQETILAAGLLAAASHILRGAESAREFVPPPLFNGQSSANPGNLDIAAIAQAIATRMSPGIPVPPGSQVPVGIPSPPPRSLAHEMAGPLPSLRRRPAPRSKPQPIPVVSPRAKCPDCGDEVATSHPRDKNIGQDPEGRVVYVLCSQERVRCEPIEE